MNPKDAIEYLDLLRITDAPLLKDAIRTAISALEKQVPIRAVGTHYANMRCPSCNHRIPSGGGSSSHRRDNWCNYCGQAIDWEVEKNV